MNSLCKRTELSEAGHIQRRYRSAARGQGPSEMVDDLPRVILDAVNERGPAPPQHGKPERVQSRAVHDTAVVPQVALSVDHGDVEQPVVGAEAGRPDDRRD